MFLFQLNWQVRRSCLASAAIASQGIPPSCRILGHVFTLNGWVSVLQSNISLAPLAGSSGRGALETELICKWRSVTEPADALGVWLVWCRSPVPWFLAEAAEENVRLCSCFASSQTKVLVHISLQQWLCESWRPHSRRKLGYSGWFCGIKENVLTVFLHSIDSETFPLALQFWVMQSFFKC